MNEVKINKIMTIDEPQNVLLEIKNLSGKNIKDIETVKKFVNSEKATCFYMDDKFSSNMECNDNSSCVLVDTGYIDKGGNPIFVSMRYRDGAFIGHITGTARTFANQMKSINRRQGSSIDTNYSKFMNKYWQKVKNRDLQHIEDETVYLVAASNRDSSFSYTPFSNLNREDFEPVSEQINDTVEEEKNEEISFNKKEEEITISLLLDKFDEMESYISDLKNTVAELTKEKKLSEERIEELEQHEKAYKEALVLVRDIENNNNVEKEDNSQTYGHSLLRGKGRILVLGTGAINKKEMEMIAKKNYGFDKKDLDFETDYDKITDSFGRVQGGRYQIVIVASTPHSAKGIAGYSSPLEALKANNSFKIVVEARNEAGRLNATMSSFKKAMDEVCYRLKNW